MSCSCNKAGFPVGGSGEPFLNWPVKKTAQVHDECSTFGSFKPSGWVNAAFNLTNSFSSAVIDWLAVDNFMLITQSANNTNLYESMLIVLRLDCILRYALWELFFSMVHQLMRR